MNFLPTALQDVFLLEPRVFGDQRGFFVETWNEATFRAAGFDLKFVQDNHSRSPRGILRGLHFQMEHTQGKLVRVAAGEVFDVVVDLRRSSPTFGQSYCVTLNAENQRMLWIPPGFAHGFYVTSDYADFMYKCTDFYHPASEQTLAWNDPTVDIDWPLAAGESPLLSAKDAQGLSFSEIPLFE
jgi:dTDP-4-dehydrorhamnose 3,5-epimerase